MRPYAVFICDLLCFSMPEQFSNRHVIIRLNSHFPDRKPHWTRWDFLLCKYTQDYAESFSTKQTLNIPSFFKKYQTVTEASRPILSNIPRGEFSLFIHAFVMVLPPMERNCTTQALKSNICICRAGKRKNIYFVPVIWRMIHTRFLNIDMWYCSYSQNRTYTGTESCNVN